MLSATKRNIKEWQSETGIELSRANIVTNSAFLSVSQTADNKHVMFSFFTVLPLSSKRLTKTKQKHYDLQHHILLMFQKDMQGITFPGTVAEGTRPSMP